MTHALYILRDDDFDAPIFASPPSDEIDEDVWQFIVDTVHDAVENEGQLRFAALLAKPVHR